MKPPLPLHCLALLLVLLAAAPATHAQLVNVRTAPVSVSEQFYTFPSQLMGMGGALALPDLEADPFANPATGARIEGTRVTGTPTIYHLSRDDGFGRALPVTLFGGGASNFIVFSIAPQELESARSPIRFFIPDGPTPARKTDRFAHNLYTFGAVGQKFEATRSAIALSASYAKIDALHVVDLLYPNAEAIEQGGRITDIRLGYLKEFADDRYLEAVLVRNNVDMEHTVTYVDRLWTPQPNGQWSQVIQPPREEFNEDNTTTWGAHLAYHRPMPDSRWRLAGGFTANAKTHPHIPNYDFMRIPRDPGHSWAFQFALGAAHVGDRTQIAFDLGYEPAWTSTWAEAATEQRSASGRTIAIGAVTVENEMVFSNTSAHAGWQHAFDDHFTGQLGVGVRHINYWLDQYSHITETDRSQDEDWTEITLSWGLRLGFSDFELRYAGHHRGGGFGTTSRFDAVMPPPVAGEPDIVAAPSGPLNMDVVPVWIHQLGISVPLGRRR